MGCTRDSKYLAYRCNCRFCQPHFGALREPPKRTTLRDLVELGDSQKSAASVEAWAASCEGATISRSFEAASSDIHFVEDLVASPCAEAVTVWEAEEDKREADEVSVMQGLRVKIRARHGRCGSATSTLADTTVYSTRSQKQHTGYEVRAHVSGSLSALERPGDAFPAKSTVREDEFTFYTEVDGSEGSWEDTLQSRPCHAVHCTPASPQSRPFSACLAHTSQQSPRRGPSSRPMSAPSARTSAWSPGNGRMPPSRMGKSGGWYGVAKAKERAAARAW